MARFVNITAAALLACLRGIGEKITAAGGSFSEGVSGREIVVDIHHHSGRGVVRVFTSLAQGASSARGCGKDAVRVVLGVMFDGEFRPLGKSRKVLRTAPQGVADREGAFLDRLTETIREGYGEAYKIEVCPDCGCPMALRRPKKGAKKQFRPFYGCIDYPKCRGTKAA